MTPYVYRADGRSYELDAAVHPAPVPKSLSIVVPTYNEEGNIESLVSAIQTTLAATPHADSYEIIVVDDDSRDGTPEILARLAAAGQCNALHRYARRGIYTAVMDGIAISTGSLVLTMDCDFSHPPELIPQLLSHIDEHDIVIGSRYVAGGSMEGNWMRQQGSRVLNRLCGIVLGVSTRDLGGNFRLFRREAFEQIEFRYPCRFAEFGLELFFRAKQRGLQVKETPFRYAYRTKGKSKLGNLPVGMAMVYIRRAFALRFEQ